MPAAVVCAAAAAHAPRPLLLSFTGSVWPRAMGQPPFDLRAAMLALHSPSRRWAEQGGLLPGLAARVQAAWRVVFADPVRAALLAAAGRPPPPS
ncbi:hypothetical protein FNF27_02308 [Cafeteria roenbergensis]|uniref:Uncharacterized protein n=1 Tax=Cafeteria roenbergensis TaxID=33653 RepID=A0A5A8CPD8_CAFRO|nr:hypothetical protein FNF29_02456 [Cafeteria roenbergensis]KAA0176251.1 hypothetical protein FNF27_02308 [Cafeteria roenbergensis]|eukprot:KAA0154579.1 hypothetical protein FNF29_02456 [Cafeteria roenbergensis]